MQQRSQRGPRRVNRRARRTRARPPEAGSSPEPSGFDFSLHMTRLCADMVARVPRLGHIDMSQVAVGFTQTRKATLAGAHACLVPLRFAGGALEMTRDGRRWAMPRLYAPDGRELLYLLIFYLPRFLDAPPGEKLKTIVHELWHIGPRFDGDLRRHQGRCYVHGRSHAAFDAQVEELLAYWRDAEPPEELYDFLRYSFRELLERHGSVFGKRIRRPRLIPLDRMPAEAPGWADFDQRKPPP